MSHYNFTGSRQFTPDRAMPPSATRGHFQDYTRSGSPFDSRRSGNSSDFGGDRQRNLSGGSGIGGYGVSSRPSSAGSNRSSSGSSMGSGVENGSSRSPSGYSNGSATLSDRIPRTRSKLSELPTFRESLRSYSPTARRTGEDILNDLKEQMRRETDTFFNSNPDSKFSSFGRKNLKGDTSNDWPARRGMDDMRNRGHHVGFPRMANWMAGDDDRGMADLSTRMAQVPNWPLSLGRRGGPFRERRGSGGSAMSATSEDDSSYDPAANDKSSQGSGGSGGLDAVSHEIPIMIEAEAPPSMMQQQPQPQQEQYQGNIRQQQYPNNGVQNHQQQVPPSSMSGPVPPLLGQVRKSPQYATRTTSAVEGGNPPEQPRATRCASAPPQMIDQTDGPNARFVSKATVTPSRSATVPISPHNNVAKPFVSTFKSCSPRAQDPIIEENFQQQPQHPQQQQEQQHQENHSQQQYPQQQQDQNMQHQHPQQQYNNHQQNHPDYQQPQQQWSDQQPYYNQPQQPQQHYQEYEQPGWKNFYANDPRGYDQDHFHQPQPQQQQHQRTSVVRNIPIFIEGQDNPILNEEKAPSLSSSPRNLPQFRQQQQPQPQHHHPSQFQQDPYWNPDQYFRSQSPFANQPTYQPQQQQQPHPNQQYYQQPQQQPAYQQHPQQQYYQQQQQPQQKPQTQHQQQPQGPHEIPIQNKPQQRQPSPQPQPPPPPVKLTPLQKIDEVRANNTDIMKKVDDFKGNKKDREFLYLDEMLTRALISLDDIDPDGNDEIRQARRALIKDINSKISLLEKKASSASPAPKESTPTPASSAANGATAENTKPDASGAESSAAAPAGGDDAPTAPENQDKKDTSSGQPPIKGEQDPTATANGKAEDAKTVCAGAEATDAPSDPASAPSVPSGDEPPATAEAIPCPAPAIPLPEK